MRCAQLRKDSYCRVYREDGRCHYPKIPENRLRKKGELYFEPMEITGSSEGTPQNPKYSLQRFFRDIEIPKLDDIAAKLSMQLYKRVVIRYQKDNAGPHQDATLLQLISAMFADRGWMFVPQPPNSPVTNTKDCSVFPAMSERVTEKQGLNFGGRAVKCGELWAMVDQVWD